MSWNKNTLFASEIDVMIPQIVAVGRTFSLHELGRVPALGLNDEEEDRENYPIRRLAWDDHVVLEQMLRSPDCDGTDVVRSVRFRKDNEPQEWPVEETLPEEQ